jgi:uncharacterized membrane protein
VTEILLLATIILGALLYDTRRRLAGLERVVHEGAYPHEDAALAESAAFDGEVAPSPSPFAVAPEGMPVTGEAQPLLPEPIVEVVPVAFEAPPEAPVYEDAPAAPPAKAASGFGFEDLFGRKLPIWAGGITLIVAAVLMVKYSIDSGLLSPVVRVMLGLVFGAALIAGAELARRRADAVRDPRVAQSLAGAGIGGLYAAVLAAANLYGLIGPGLAFAGLAAITGLAMVLALRFGVACALLGLVGGLATPAVVQSTAPSIPLLAGYLAIVIGSLTLLSRRQRWVWLGFGALAGGLGWTLVLILVQRLDGGGTLSLGLLVLLLGLGIPALTFERRVMPVLHAVAAAAAAVQLALLVATGAFSPLTWGLYGLLSLAFVWLAARTPALRKVVTVPVLTALGLVALWPAPGAALFAGVIGGIVAIYGGYALRRLWREGGGLIETGLLAAIPLVGYALCLDRFHVPGLDGRFALLGVAFAALPGAGAVLGWRRSERRDDARFALNAACAGLMLVFAATVGFAAWTAPISIAVVGAALLALSVKARDHRLSLAALAFQAAAIVALPLTDAAWVELDRFVDAVASPHPAQALARWAAVVLAGAAFAWRFAGKPLGLVLQPVAAVLGYGLVAQVVPAPWLAVAIAVALAALTEANRRRPALALVPALATLAGIAGLWAVEPLGIWIVAAVLSLFADPVFVTELPAQSMTAQRLLAPAIACAFLLWRTGGALPVLVQRASIAVTGVIGLAVVHVFYKHLFAIGDAAAFVRAGLAERTLWEIALIGAGAFAWRVLGHRLSAAALVAAGLAHGVFYTLLLHDPLWSAQEVGSWPLVNLLLPAFAIAFAGPWLLARIVPDHAPRLARPFDLLRMVAVVLFAFATLRQLFAGPDLTGPAIGAAENIGWSVLAIALAVGFLLWGMRQALRDWRIASLVLMLVAVIKVFVFDASGLEGLLRIVSFLALGFSLIGIGWLYSRSLKSDGKEPS